ncbi:outer membrane lipoprotein carrier protein LolA [Simiduia agarivorans]|uniref:Outer membrane lipoprotein carrier protein LolA n=1 Tax=Simiduia agarivorans (strain DSM 21679 / JCM 13881 / BCRC 17597 / SA1) TaxID=1117647 RepID=K4KK30_SIMAS|nr:outer membrane lipoprotein carrier protein LolA [Simiduia agarivorans]AFU98585.1 hypothetical protein M5M_06950 [Simiduia agarivorans SA1 = DSM 21679]
MSRARLWPVMFYLLAMNALATAPHEVAEALSVRLTTPLTEGEFQQWKTVQGLPLALESSGEFAVQDQQLHWRTLKPFASETRFTTEAIEQWSGGQRVWSLSRTEQPVVAVVSELMRALVRGDVTALLAHFAVTDLALDGDCWRLDLKVRDVALQQAITRVGAEGCERVQQLIVEETNANSTRIRLVPLP